MVWQLLLEVWSQPQLLQLPMVLLQQHLQPQGQVCVLLLRVDACFSLQVLSIFKLEVWGLCETSLSSSPVSQSQLSQIGS